MLRPIERIYAGVVYLKKEKDFRTEERRLRYEDRVQTKLGNRARSIIKGRVLLYKKVRTIHIYNHIVDCSHSVLKNSLKSHSNILVRATSISTVGLL